MAFFPLFLDPATQQGALTFVTMGAVISSCTAFYGSLLVILGNAAARRLAPIAPSPDWLHVRPVYS
jgi:threonine/homoserine/homoserine lactone efflux protein